MLTNVVGGCLDAMTLMLLLVVCGVFFVVVGSFCGFLFVLLFFYFIVCCWVCWFFRVFFVLVFVGCCFGSLYQNDVIFGPFIKNVYLEKNYRV